MGISRPDTPIGHGSIPVSVASHELKNLLTAILGNAELALMDVTPQSPLFHSLTQIQEAAQRAVDLTTSVSSSSLGNRTFATTREKPEQCVLLVDDEPGVREAVTRMLQRSGYRVLGASSGEEGLLRLRQFKAEIKVAIIDLSLPGIDGVETLRAIRDYSPEVKTILWSGFDEATIRDRVSGLDSVLCLEKTSHLMDLGDVLRRLFAGDNSSS